jgi:DNA-cytosine methyltransferase
MNVLSLFDGMSCGQQALDRLGVKVDNYFASEIDKYAIQVTMANYPNTKQLGSVVNVDGYSLPKIDLLLGGSPCQSFSFAGKRKGMATKCETEILTLEHYLQLKQEGFEFEGQSYLFWEYMRLLNECKPTYFLLENVEMGEKWEKVLSKAIGVNGIHINSALVSAQNRRRIYWTNIGMQPSGLFGDLESIIEQPKDRGILLKDILQDNPNAKFYLSNKMVNYVSKTGTKNFYYKPEFANPEGKAKPITMVHDKRAGTTNYICQEIDEKYFLSEKAINKCLKSTANENMLTTDNKDKSGCLIAGYYKTPFDGTYVRDKQFTGLDLNAKSRTIRNGGSATATDKHNWDLIVHNTMPRSSTSGKGGTGHLSRADGKTYCLDTGNTNAVEVRQVKQISTNNKSNGGTQPYQQDRIYDIDGISPALQAQLTKGSTMINTSRIRRLTPIECERLQTVADNYTNHVSDSQRYKMLGNGWTIDVIAHILKYANF